MKNQSVDAVVLIEIKTIKHKILSNTLSLSPDSCNLIIDCVGGGVGLDFIVAESDEDHAQHRWEAYGRLDAGWLPERSWWGGFSVGVSLHHVVADGHSFSWFMKF
ncbi:hypothetical protein QJS10_CPB04g00422 [Acorus calamus]|uniref:Uncharacterized protein n=1 Tax=Acorus calamus TaxID=4465 RepID=A0AAV9F0K2_ACOCL|nr:hypothetical protein QJS10_CPB04g00422 [Acorus calamus]